MTRQRNKAKQYQQPDDSNPKLPFRWCMNKQPANQQHRISQNAIAEQPPSEDKTKKGNIPSSMTKNK